MRNVALLLAILLCTFTVTAAIAADNVPTDIQQPGTQPTQVSNLESPDRCDNCHAGYDTAVEPAYNWRGSMHGNAGRDPIFWATLAVAEQDFAGAGGLCLRCHSTGGYYAGRGVPTDGSGLDKGDADGVDCDNCHKSTNPDNSEHLGVMISPYIANDKGTPATGYYGTGMESLWGGSDKLGPYSDPEARHQFLQSKYHRSVDFCGQCHDVSNPAVGDLAHNHGTQPTATYDVVASGVPGAAVDGKAAFNNFPFQYGIVERTFSEYKSGALPQTLVSSYASLPDDLEAGAIKAAYEAALVAGKGGDYADGADRYYSCQTCHMRAVTGAGANKSGLPIRPDLPLHDFMGGNYWAADMTLYQNTQGTLRLGGDLDDNQIAAITAGKERAKQQLRQAASLTVTEGVVKITNLTGHKLMTGFYEGRRMWLNIKWYDAAGTLLREDGKYGDLAVNSGGKTATVRTILDLDGANTKIYEAHLGMTQEWANQLLSLGYSPALPLSFDRITGAVDYTLGDLAAQAPGTSHKTFHFVLNNTVVTDNRLLPYGFNYETARQRNVLPAPADQYRNADGSYRHYDELALNPPAGAAHAEIKLLYQPTTWEYIQFLDLANNDQSAFLGAVDDNLVDAWLNTGMAEPYVMASWSGSAPCSAPAAITEVGIAKLSDTQVRLVWEPAAGASEYRVWWDDSNPYFLPGGNCAAGALNCEVVTSLVFDHTSLGSTATHHTYLVQPYASCGALQTTPSKRTGEFEFSLVAGQ